MLKTIAEKLFGASQPLTREENFAQANKLVLLVAIFNAVYVSSYLGSIFDSQSMSYDEVVPYCVAVELLLMLGVIVCAIKRGFDDPKLPYIMLGLFLAFDSVLYSILGYMALFLFLLTVVLCARYHDVQIVRRIVVAGVICLLLSGILGVIEDAVFPIIHSVHSYFRLDFDDIALFIVDLFPSLCVFLMACAISYGITVAGSGLQKGNAALARARSDLEAAANIQRQLLPENVELGEDNPFGFHAALVPMYKASGDYYDGAHVGSYCFFEVADVSDKGLPAAMFAMRAQSLLRQCVLDATPLEGVLAANRALCQNNDGCMFVTVVLGTLDLETGRVVYVSAGHEPLAVRRGEKVELLEPEDPDPALGLFDDADFHVHELMLGEGDVLFAFTDGVSDAENESGERYGTARLVECLGSLEGMDAKSVCDGVFSSVSDFCGTLDQNDDMTALALSCSGAPKGFETHRVVDCNAKGLAAITSEVLDQVRRVCCPEEARSFIGTIIDEVGSNIIEHAFEDVVGRVFEIDCRIEPKGIELRFVDEGVPFNPLEAEETYVGQDEDGDEELQIGGWGIHLVCSLADKVSYKRENDRNVLTVELHW